MQLFAPAKINLSLKILRRREDGFHEIDTLMAPISLCDELTIEPNESDAGIAFTSDDPTLPAGEDNLVVRAARSFFAEIRKEPRVRITLRKRIPHGAGLGGGSSDAASTLLGLNELHGEALTPARLTSLAAGIGSDVAFFLVRGAAHLSRARGDRRASRDAAALVVASLETGIWSGNAVGVSTVARCPRVAGRGLHGAESGRPGFAKRSRAARF